MGRQPNPLISEHFHRGTKLQDNSNRYQHTCKACGQLFPKGRIETLLTHVLKKCRSIPIEHRQVLLPRAHPTNFESSVVGDGGRVSQTNCDPLPAPQGGHEDGYNPLNILAAAANNGSGSSFILETASLRHGLPLDPGLDDDDSFASSFLNMTDDNVAPKLSNSFASPATTVVASFDSTNSLHETPSSQHTSSNVETVLGSQGSELESITTSATEALHNEPCVDFAHGSIAEELFLDKPGPVPSSGRTGGNPLNQSLLVQPTSPQELASPTPIPYTTGTSESLRKLAMQPRPGNGHFITEFGTPTRSPKPKIRGKFTPERRKEVQNIRKLGACMRCRMLKKTCSGGTPCQACDSIEAPRLWKKCTRTRLVNLFSLFSTGLQSILCYRDVTAIKAATTSEAFDGYIEAFHFDQVPAAITFKVLQAKTSSQDEGSGRYSVTSESAIETQCGRLMLDPDTDDADLNSRMESYLKAVSLTLMDSELSPIVSATLETARNLVLMHSDSILERTMELWSAVLLLVDSNFMFKFVARPGTADPVSCTQQSSETGLPLSRTDWPHSFILINLQLRAIVDKWAGNLARSIMIDLERRLVQRSTEDRSHTFIAAVLLLNCMERMCWHFAKWEQEPLRDSWPLDQPPNKFAGEGDAFARLLDTLLGWRGISPTVTIDPERKIIVAVGNADELIRDWFEKIAVTTEFFRIATDRPNLTDDCRSLDMKLINKLIRLDDPHFGKDAMRPDELDTIMNG
jgi:hypothetical protein